MNRERARGRIAVDIAVTLTTVLDTTDARIVDLSEDGALIVGASFSEGAKFQIGYRDQIVYAQCRWSEIDRLGASFPFGLHDGPLYDRLLQARAIGDQINPAIMPAPANALPPVRTSGGRTLMPASGGSHQHAFGRRLTA